eukprot:2492520-Karenia_brevis.AAC.1
MHQVGPGGYKILLSPGTRTYELEESHTGHLMLPCSRFQGHPKQPTEFLANAIEDHSTAKTMVNSEPVAKALSGDGVQNDQPPQHNPT